MCEPISTEKHNYKALFTATGKCDMGEVHTVHSSKYCQTFADTFKATREFWTANKGKTITVTLTINPEATDHLKVRS